MEFGKIFKTATDHDPYPYQKKLAEDAELPELLDIPTGCGKTAAVVMAWLWRRRFADEDIRNKTPRRLVYCLPMRVLVEQTRDNAVIWLKNLGLLGEGPKTIFEKNERGDIKKVVEYEPSWKDSDKINVTVLMGGEDADEWDLYPERDAIIIGTQDMLLSRALNRGYGMSRYRWPVHFGLLNNDCLWVMDEVQLMGNGLATTTQLHGFRDVFGTLLPVQSIWMSATMRQEWLKTVDFSHPTLRTISLLDIDQQHPVLKPRINAVKPVEKADFAASKDGKEEANHVLKMHEKLGPKSRTLVVVNTVKRAQDIYRQLVKKGPAAKLILIHSRFRPDDRDNAFKTLLATPDDAGTIGITTQVVEAGVDISARLLITDLAPWSSMVQRFGRCNRNGEYNEDKSAKVVWISPPDIDDDKKLKSAPYTAEELRLSAERLTPLTDVGSSNLPSFDDPMTFVHVVRRKDLTELFDTTPDLAGADIDVSRFIREADEYHVQVFWRDIDEKEPDEKEPGPAREELCSVPIGDLKGRKARRWDYLEKRWPIITNIYPGLTLMLRAKDGGYSSELGWTGKDEYTEHCKIAGNALDYNDRDGWYDGQSWQTIAEHTDAVVNEVRGLQDMLPLVDRDFNEALITSARWHDVGKAHPVFQKAINSDSAPQKDIWGKSALKMARYERPGFRHELASALTMLTNGHSNLSVYLAAAHHGKVRLSIRSIPIEKMPPNNPGRLFARGIWDGDYLPQVDLGDGVIAPATKLILNYMRLGDDETTGPSWLSRMLALRDDPEICLGPFRLAYLETVLRVSDWRASALTGVK